MEWYMQWPLSLITLITSSAIPTCLYFSYMCKSIGSRSCFRPLMLNSLLPCNAVTLNPLAVYKLITAFNVLMSYPFDLGVQAWAIMSDKNPSTTDEEEEQRRTKQKQTTSQKEKKVRSKSWSKIRSAKLRNTQMWDQNI